MRIDRQLVASDDDGPRFTLLGVGELVGDMELCMMVDGEKYLSSFSNRPLSVVSVLDDATTAFLMAWVRGEVVFSKWLMI